MLKSAGHNVRVLSRSARNDPDYVQGQIATGEGLAEAVKDIDVIIHLASHPTQSQAVDVDGAARLIEHGRKASLKHFIYMSIVGVDKHPFPYYKQKYAAEQVVAQSGVPYTIYRATQFYPFIQYVLKTFLRFHIVPRGWRAQPISVEEAAQGLVEVVEKGAVNGIVNKTGPKVYTINELIDIWEDVDGKRRRYVSLPIPGGASRGFRKGLHTIPEQKDGKVTWREYLESA
jgi:uncharacterized protein YbjT (DUF2867 family)